MPRCQRGSNKGPFGVTEGFISAVVGPIRDRQVIGNVRSERIGEGEVASSNLVVPTNFLFNELAPLQKGMR
jgi:hypothetical protein